MRDVQPHVGTGPRVQPIGAAGSLAAKKEPVTIGKGRPPERLSRLGGEHPGPFRAFFAVEESLPIEVLDDVE